MISVSSEALGHDEQRRCSERGAHDIDVHAVAIELDQPHTRASLAADPLLT